MSFLLLEVKKRTWYDRESNCVLGERDGEQSIKKGPIVKMTYEEIVNKVRKIFKDSDVSDIKEHYAFQFNIEGEGEGAFYIEVKEGQLYIEPYEYYDRDSIFQMKADVLFKIISGKLDPVLAFTTGKLKVDGDLGKALKLKELI